MSVILKINNHLQAIKAKEVSFQKLINKGLKNGDEKELLIMRDALKSIVNRYYFLAWEQNKIQPIEDEILRDYFICALGIYHYVKNIDEEFLISCFNQDADEFAVKYSPEEFITSINGLDGSTYPLSEKENEIILRRLAISYAYPDWICKMMSKHFGIKNTYKAIVSSRKNTKICLNVNPFLTNADELIKSNENFQKGVLTDNTLRYVGKGNIIDLNEYKKNKIFVEDESTQFLVEKLSINPGDEVLIYIHEKPSCAIDAMMAMRDVGMCRIAAQDILDYNQIKYLTGKYKLHSYDLFESSMKNLITHIPYDLCDKVLCVPKSSSLGLVRRNPAILLTLKREDIDQYIENQRYDIEEASKFVREGGTLEYACFTYNKKETFNIVQEFIEKHPEFSLVEAKQIFAHNAPSDGVFYAILKRD